MAGNVVRIPTSKREVEDAWSDYEAAQRHARAVFDDQRSTSRERMEAQGQVIRSHKRFEALFLRWDS